MFFKCFVQMSVQIDSEILWGGAPRPESHVFLLRPGLPRSRCRGSRRSSSRAVTTRRPTWLLIPGPRCGSALRTCDGALRQSPAGRSVIWATRWGWGRSRNCAATGRGWRGTRGTCRSRTGPRCAASTAAPRSPWTGAC